MKKKRLLTKVLSSILSAALLCTSVEPITLFAEEEVVVSDVEDHEHQIDSLTAEDAPVTTLDVTDMVYEKGNHTHTSDGVTTYYEQEIIDILLDKCEGEIVEERTVYPGKTYSVGGITIANPITGEIVSDGRADLHRDIVANKGDVVFKIGKSATDTSQKTIAIYHTNGVVDICYDTTNGTNNEYDYEIKDTSGNVVLVVQVRRSVQMENSVKSKFDALSGNSGWGTTNGWTTRLDLADTDEEKFLDAYRAINAIEPVSGNRVNFIAVPKFYSEQEYTVTRVEGYYYSSPFAWDVTDITKNYYDGYYTGIDIDGDTVIDKWDSSQIIYDANVDGIINDYDLRAYSQGHYEKCLVCGYGMNPAKHSYLTRDNNTCNIHSTANNVTCSCGFSAPQTKLSHIDGHTQKEIGRHFKSCIRSQLQSNVTCNSWTGYETCILSDGTSFEHNTVGTCIICGQKQSKSEVNHGNLTIFNVDKGDDAVVREHVNGTYVSYGNNNIVVEDTSQITQHGHFGCETCGMDMGEYTLSFDRTVMHKTVATLEVHFYDTYDDETGFSAVEIPYHHYQYYIDSDISCSLYEENNAPEREDKLFYLNGEKYTSEKLHDAFLNRNGAVRAILNDGFEYGETSKSNFLWITPGNTIKIVTELDFTETGDLASTKALPINGEMHYNFNIYENEDKTGDDTGQRYLHIDSMQIKSDNYTPALTGEIEQTISSGEDDTIEMDSSFVQNNNYSTISRKANFVSIWKDFKNTANIICGIGTGKSDGLNNVSDFTLVTKTEKSTMNATNNKYVSVNSSGNTIKDYDGNTAQGYYNLYTNNLDLTDYEIEVVYDKATFEDTNYFLKAEDDAGNVTYVPVSITNIDTKAPLLSFEDGNDNWLVESASDVTNNWDNLKWSQSRTLEVVAEDYGVSGIAIAFNNKENVSFANANAITTAMNAAANNALTQDKYFQVTDSIAKSTMKNSGSRTYELVGDVYDETGKVLTVYAKDTLGNVRETDIVVYKLDNTAPTIESIVGNGNGITVTFHDEHETLGEGSGVSYYALNKNSSSSGANWKAVNEGTTSIDISVSEGGTILYDGTYYLHIKDNAGNITTKKVIIHRVEVYANAGIKNVTESSTTGLVRKETQSTNPRLTLYVIDGGSITTRITGTYTGYSFKNWTHSDGTVLSTNASYSSINITQSFGLDANAEIDGTPFEVYYYEADDTVALMDEGVVGIDYEIKGSEGVLQKLPDHQIFDHWDAKYYDDNTGYWVDIGEMYAGSDTYSGEYGALHLFPVFNKRTEPYTITYYPNGATGSSLYKQTVPITQYGAEISAASFEDTGYTSPGDKYEFLGWLVIDEATAFSIENPLSMTLNQINLSKGEWLINHKDYFGDSTGGIIAPVQDMYLVAYWAEKEYTVTYYSNDDNDNVSSMLKYYDEDHAIQNITELGFSYNKGYIFKGWATTATGNVKYHPDGKDNLGHTYSDIYAENDNLTLYAKWAELVDLSVDLDGGTWFGNDGIAYSETGNEVDAFFADLGEAGYCQYVAKNIPVKEGYVFTNWTISSGSAIQMGSNNIMLRGNTSIKANWTPVYEVNIIKEDGIVDVTYSVYNSSTNLISASKLTNGLKLKVRTGSEVTVTAKTDTGYDFDYWKSAISSGSSTYTDESVEFTITENTDLTAYGKKKTYTVTYDANGGTGTIASQTKIYDIDITLADNHFSYIGKKFANWNTSADGSGISYMEGATYSLNEDITLYAQWTDASNNTITYHANGGSGTMEVQTKVYGATVIIADNEFTHTDWWMIKDTPQWNTIANGSGTSYSAGDEYSANEDLNLYAQWKATDYTYVLTLDANGGIFLVDEVDGEISDWMYTFKHGNEVIFCTGTSEMNGNIINIPTREGYILTGWEITSGGGSIDEKSDGTWAYDGLNDGDANNPGYGQDVYISAIWTPVYTVTINGEYGIDSVDYTLITGEIVTESTLDKTKTVVVTEGSKLILSATPSTNYNFEKWTWSGGATSTQEYTVTISADITYTATGSLKSASYQVKHYLMNDDGSNYTLNEIENGSGLIGTEITPSVKTTGDYEKYKKPVEKTETIVADGSTIISYYYDRYVLTVDANGGNYTGASPLYLITGETADITTPTRTDYKFSSWTVIGTASTCEKESGNLYEFTMGTSDATITAQWTKLADFVITYVANGGSGSMATQTKQEGSTVTIKTNAFTSPTKAEAYKWNTASDGSGTWYNAGDEYSTDADLTLYAIWTYPLSTKTGTGINATTQEFVSGLCTKTATTEDGVTTGWYIGGSKVTIDATVDTANHYAWTNWTDTNGTVVSNNKSDTITISSSSTYTANAKLTIADYTVKHYLMNSNGSTYTLQLTETLTGLIGNEVTPNVIVTGDYAKYKTPSAKSITITEDGQASVSYYYDRYVLTIDANGVNYSGNNPVYLITGEQTTITHPSNTGHKLTEWTANSNNSNDCTINQGANLTVFTMGSADTTITAQWELLKYTITYDANGGTGIMSPQEKTYGVKITILENSFTPIVGTGFASWNTKPDGTGTKYEPGEEYSLNEDVKLYAIWGLNTYSITYNANGGTGSMTSQTKTHDVSIQIRDNGFTPPVGYSFNNWNTQADGLGTTYAAGEMYTLNKEINLYAQWNEIYDIKIDLNGGDWTDNNGGSHSETGNSVDVTIENVSLNGTYVLNNTPTRDGYLFVEWQIVSGGGSIGNDGKIITFDGSDIVIKAVWLAIYEVNIQKGTGIDNVGYLILSDNNDVINVVTNNLGYVLTVKTGTKLQITATTETNFAFNKWAIATGGSTQENINTTVSITVTSHVTCIADAVSTAYPVYTNPLQINGAYQKDDVYYVRADGITEFTLTSNAYVEYHNGNPGATETYQINHMKLAIDNVSDSLNQDVTVSRINDTSDGTFEIDELTRVVTGTEVFGNGEDISFRRYGSLNCVEQKGNFVIGNDYDAKVFNVVPKAGAINISEVNWSDDEKDALNGITIIPDGKAPTFSGDGLVFLQNFENIDRADFTPSKVITITATDSGSGVNSFSINIVNQDNSLSRTYAGTINDDGTATISIDVMEKDMLFYGDIDFEIYAIDNVGNEAIASEGLAEFSLVTYLRSMRWTDEEKAEMGHTPNTFKQGEKVALIVRTSGYANKLYIEFPSEFDIDGFEVTREIIYDDPLVATGQYESDLINYGVRTEVIEFNIPMGTPELDNYEIHVTAFKGGSEVEVSDGVTVRTLTDTQVFNIDGDIWEGLRTVIISN